MSNRFTGIIGAMVIGLAAMASLGQDRVAMGGKERIGDTVAADVRSPHPYPAGLTDGSVIWRHTFTKPGATFVRLHFSFDTSLSIDATDVLVVRDGTGKVVRRYSGQAAADHWSDIMVGNTATIELVAGPDGGGGYGVNVDQIAWGTVSLSASPQIAGSTGFSSICGTSVPSRIRTSDPVARLVWNDDCGGVFSCSGWLFSPMGHLMTNAHCANSQSEADNLTVYFNWIDAACKLPGKPAPDVYSNGITFDRMNCNLDYAVHIINDPIKGNPAEVYGHFKMNLTTPPAGTEIWIPQHPSGMRRQIAESCVINDPSESGFNGCADPGGGATGCGNTGFPVGLSDLSFDCAIAGGSSGSPVLNLNDEVIAIAHAANQIEAFGVRMDKVALDIPNFPVGIEITGPSMVNEDVSAPFTAIVSNLSRPDRDVTTRNVWSIDPPTAGSISSAGLFTPDPVDADRSVTIRATYTDAGVTVEAQLVVVVRNVTVDTAIIDVTLTPSTDPTLLQIGQSFSVDVAVATDGATVSDVRLLQFDTSLTTGATVDSFNWVLEDLTDPSLYFLFQDGNVYSATYTSSGPLPGFIVELTSTPQVVARIDMTFTGDGMLNVLGAINPPNGNESAGFQSGFDVITVFTQEKFNIIGGTLAVAEGNVPLTILSSNPPDGAIDARQPSDVDGTNPSGWQSVELTFNGAVAGLLPGDFEITQNGGSGVAPTVLSVTPIDPTTVQLLLSDRIDPGARTTMTYLPTTIAVTLAYLPGDVNSDGTSSPLDILALIDDLNGVESPLPSWSTDVDRSGAANASDILRVIDLLNGAGAYDVWNGASLP